MSETIAPPQEVAHRQWLRGLWLYAVMILAALVGIGFTSTGGPEVSGWGPSIGWVWATVLAIYFCACVWQGWPHAVTNGLRTRLVVTQGLHWLAFFGALALLQTDGIRGVVNDDAEGVAMILLLAIGTFVAGVHAWSVPVALTGVILALATPLIAWIEQTAVLLFILAACAAIVFVPVWYFWRRYGRSEAALPEL